jgi:putative SOS response-associated peptidase YedK
MCGRFTLQIPAEMLSEIFGITEPPSFPIEPRYNIAPTQQIPVVRQYADSQSRLDSMRWGLVPAWTKEAPSGPPLINARSETVAEKPSFRLAIKYRRCLIPVSGFYEWRREGERKTPVYIKLKNGSPMVFAGIWESWKGPDGKTTDSCSILTTAANDLMSPIHDRMPVILNPGNWEQWLERDQRDPEKLRPLYQPYPGDEIEMYPVSSMVNSVKNGGPELIDPQ